MGLAKGLLKRITMEMHQNPALSALRVNYENTAKKLMLKKGRKTGYVAATPLASCTYTTLYYGEMKRLVCFLHFALQENSWDGLRQWQPGSGRNFN